MITLKEYNKKFTDSFSTITNEFIENESVIFYHSNEPSYYNPLYNFHYSKGNQSHLDFLKSKYTYDIILPTIRHDLPSNFQDIRKYNSFNAPSPAVSFIKDNNIEPFEQLQLFHWIRNFYFKNILNSFNIILNIPTQELYYRHNITIYLIEHIYTQQFRIGCQKTKLSEFEIELIKIYKPLANLDLLQINMNNYSWINKPDNNQKYLKKYLKLHYNLVVSNYNHISKIYSFAD
jgi:hypothetical protein